MSDRRASDTDETGREMRRLAAQYPHLVTWVLMALVGLLVAGGGVYLRGYEARLTATEKQEADTHDSVKDQKAVIDVIDERQKRAVQDIQEIKSDVKDIQRDIKELLRQDQRRRDGSH